MKKFLNVLLALALAQISNISQRIIFLYFKSINPQIMIKFSISKASYRYEKAGKFNQSS